MSDYPLVNLGNDTSFCTNFNAAFSLKMTRWQIQAGPPNLDISSTDGTFYLINIEPKLIGAGEQNCVQAECPVYENIKFCIN